MRNTLILNIFLVLIGLHFTNQKLIAQKHAKIAVNARNFNDSVVIRWAPDKASAWKFLCNYGYIVERRTVYKNKVFINDNPEIKIITESPIKPFSKAYFEKVGDTSTYMLLVYQALYGETFELNAEQKNASGPLALINKASEMDNRFSYSIFAADMSPKAAQAQALWFTDKTVKPGERYIYRVYSAVPKEIMPIDSGFVYVNIADTFQLPKPIEFNAEFRNKSALLSWNKEFFERIYINYVVERSDDGGQTYTILNDVPVISPYSSKEMKSEYNYYVDAFPQNNVLYKYRVRGITIFGETGPPSAIVEGNGYETGTFLNPQIVGYDVSPDNRVIIKWKLTHSDSIYIMGFDVLRAQKNEGPFKKLNSQILGASDRIYIDSFPSQVNYYTITAYDAEGQKFPSFTTMVQLIDSTPPAPPKNLTGYIDSTGLVHLKWKENTEPDFSAYRVFKANNPLAEFVKVNQLPVKYNAFNDTVTLLTLSRYIYYKVTALDQRYNQSAYSETIRLLRPDIVPPSSPAISSYEISDTGIIINYISSYSDDVSYHLLERYSNDEKNIQRVAVVTDTSRTASIVDSLIESNMRYTYLLSAFDSSGLKSQTSSILVKTPVTITKQLIKNFEVFINYQTSGIQLQWDINNENVENILVFKGAEDKRISRYKLVSGKDDSFLDKNVRKQTKYIYCIQIFYKNGDKSKLSNQVSVTY